VLWKEQGGIWVCWIEAREGDLVEGEEEEDWPNTTATMTTTAKWYSRGGSWIEGNAVCQEHRSQRFESLSMSAWPEGVRKQAGTCWSSSSHEKTQLLMIMTSKAMGSDDNEEEEEEHKEEHASNTLL
jgi:hypothetical protein